jgi:RecB family exonuclease
MAWAALLAVTAAVTVAPQQVHTGTDSSAAEARAGTPSQLELTIASRMLADGGQKGEGKDGGLGRCRPGVQREEN